MPLKPGTPAPTSLPEDFKPSWSAEAVLGRQEGHGILEVARKADEGSP
jgi:hypothetical protein